jgi:hypothetical protein
VEIGETMPHVQPFMMPKMNRTATLGPGGKSVTITGPINWNANPIPAALVGAIEEIAAVFTLVVSQVQTPPAGGVVVTAIGWSDEMYVPGQVDWDGTANVIDPAAKLVKGGATVAAWASIAHSDGGYASYEWTLPVELQ